MNNPFLSLLEEGIEDRNTHLCVGLDPEVESLPEGIPRDPEGVFRFLSEIIETTWDLTCAYKPNLAFFGSLGAEGLNVLGRLIEKCRGKRALILDAKFGDIGNTARHYARMAFDTLGADAVTVNPYLGIDSLGPFLSREDRFTFVLGITSNPGSSDIQKLRLHGGARVFENFAIRLEKTFPGACWGWVAGATQIEEMRVLRAASAERWLLIPGVGTQGGELAGALRLSRDPSGVSKAVINASRSILYASRGADYAESAHREALRMVEETRAALAGATDQPD